MQGALEQLAAGASLALAAVAILVVLYGAGEAVLDIVTATRGRTTITRRAIWLHFALWLLAFSTSFSSATSTTCAT
jgi:hypothetical protein